MSVDFEAWLNQPRTTRCYLVELTFLKKADLSTVTLYLSTHPYPDAARRRGIVVDKPYSSCVKGIPRLARTAGSILQPDRMPSWGELELHTKPDYKPDLARSLTWSALLSSAYTAWGQRVTIRLGDPSWDYADFEIIFSGLCSNLYHGDITSTLVVVDKSADFSQKYPDYEFPADNQVVESNWNKSVWLIMGCVKNYKPVLINTAESGPYPHKYSLACHVLNALPKVYLDGAETASPGNWEFVQKGVSPVTEDYVEGSAYMRAWGPYTGELRRGKWLVEIASITMPNSQGNSGPEVGLARFRWSMDGGLTWLGEDMFTWKLAPDTVTKNPAAGTAAMAVSGDYTGDCKLPYIIKITRPGDLTDAIPPQFIFSDDDGDTWLPDNSAVWTPIASAPGVSSVTAFNPGDSVLWEITTAGNVGGAVRFKWSRNGGTSYTTDVSIPDTNPIELFPGFSVQFTAPGIPATDDYDAGDFGESSAAIDLVEGATPGSTDPIALNRGLSAVFSGTGAWSDNPQWVPFDDAAGVMSIASIDPEFDAAKLETEITTGGRVGVGPGVFFKWQYNGAGWTTNVEIPDTNPIELFAGLSVQFTAPSQFPPFPIDDDYDAGDAWVNIPYYTSTFVVNDAWNWTWKEIPIPLEDGVSVQFFPEEGQHFYVGDKFTFILMSLLLLRAVEETTEVTVDGEGLDSPVTGSYTDKIGEMIRTGAILLLGWNADDFDADAMTAFNAAFPYQAGLGVESPTEYGEIVKTLLGGIPAIYSMTLDGKFRLAELTPPAGAPLLVINDTNIQGRPQHGNSEEDKKIYRRVYLTYDRNYNTGGQTSGVSQERLEWLKNETRQVSARDDAVKQVFSLASDLGPLDTCLTNQADAQAVADKDLALFKVEWDSVTVDLKTQPYTREIGEPVELRRAKFGLDEGKLLNIHGLDLDFAANKSTLNLWG